MKENNLTLIIEEKPPDLEFTPVFSQPKLTKIKSSKNSMEKLIKWALICYHREDKEEFGRIYNQLLQEYKPILDWAYLSWDYLLTTQGFRYLPRKGVEKYYSHGDYRACTQGDYKKLINKCFKTLLLNYPVNGCFSSYLRNNFWSQVVKEYEILKVPKDKKERLLTDYSYLRCIPYQFLNRYHEEKVKQTLRILEKLEFQILELYFLKFYTDEAAAQESKLELNKFIEIKQIALDKIRFRDYLSYALLKQIERY